MIVIINGEKKEIVVDKLSELILDLNIIDKVMGVVINDTVIKKKSYDTCRLKEGDNIDFLSFVAGG